MASANEPDSVGVAAVPDALLPDRVSMLPVRVNPAPGLGSAPAQSVVCTGVELSTKHPV
jgi:hypothetical protein